jgi:hypothetical protein
MTAPIGTAETVENSSPVGKPAKAGLSATSVIQATAGTLNAGDINNIGHCNKRSNVTTPQHHKQIENGEPPNIICDRDKTKCRVFILCNAVKWIYSREHEDLMRNTCSSAAGPSYSGL